MDKATLEHQINILNADLTSLNATYQERTKQLQQISVEIERLNGAREYHGIVLQRLQKDLAAIVLAEQTPKPPQEPTTTPPTLP